MCICFYTLFNNIDVKKIKSDALYQFRVPLSYVLKQKFLDRLAEEPNLSDRNRSAITLPRMAFELTGFEYDRERQQNKLIEQSRINTNQMQKEISICTCTIQFKLYIIYSYKKHE